MSSPKITGQYCPPPTRAQRRAITRSRTHYSRAMNACPPGWLVIERYEQGLQWRLDFSTTVIATVEVIQGKHWLHVSAARHDRVPYYEELAAIKHILFGPNLRAFMVFPEQKNHVNIHEFCLHLFGSAKGDGLPEFSKDGTI